jgi:2'-5' RNA ligase
LFVAIDVSDDTRAQLTSVREALAASLNRARRAPRVTWVASEAAHVTVRFIGEVSDSAGEQVCEVLRVPLPHAVYDLEFAGVGAFPNSRRPRLVWIGAVRGQYETARLAALVNDRLDLILGPAEPRDFRAHLTVARVKEPIAFDWNGAFSRVQPSSSVSQIDHVTLYRSKTGPRGPTYTPVIRVPFTTT